MKKVSIKPIKGGEWRVSYPSWGTRISEHYPKLSQALIRYMQLRLKKSEHHKKHR
jgi:hypothetical protein